MLRRPASANNSKSSTRCATRTGRPKQRGSRSGSSSSGLLAGLKKEIPPRKIKAAPSKRELRLAVQGKDEISRATKRQQLAEQGTLSPRGPDQTLLESAAVAPRTAEEYKHKITLFQSFCKIQKFKTRKPKDVDDALTLFLNQSFIEGWSIAEANKCVAAVMDWKPQISKHQLPRSRRALQGWKNLDPGVTRPPLPWSLIALIVIQMIENKCLVEAMAVLLMFVVYARPGEVFGLRRKDLVGSHSLGRDWALNLHPSEDLQASKVDVNNETVLLNSQEVPWLGMALSCVSHIPDGPLIPSSYQAVHNAWLLAQKALRLPDPSERWSLDSWASITYNCEVFGVVFRLRSSFPCLPRPWVYNRSLGH